MVKKGDIQLTLSLISKELKEEKTGKLGFTKTTLLNSIGKDLGEILLKEDWKFKRSL